MPTQHKRKVKPGDRFYSPFFKSWGTVTEYIDDENWWFRLDTKKFLWIFPIKQPELKARAKPEDVGL